MEHLSRLQEWSTESETYLVSVDVPLPNAQTFINDVNDLAWTNALTYAGLAVSVIGVAVLLRAITK